LCKKHFDDDSFVSRGRKRAKHFPAAIFIPIRVMYAFGPRSKAIFPKMVLGQQKFHVQQVFDDKENIFAKIPGVFIRRVQNIIVVKQMLTGTLLGQRLFFWHPTSLWPHNKKHVKYEGGRKDSLSAAGCRGFCQVALTGCFRLLRVSSTHFVASPCWSRVKKSTEY
jgi:hypothetical protein